MLQYNPVTRVLKATQVNLGMPDIDLYHDIIESYNKFKNETIFECISYLERTLQKIAKDKKVTITTRIGKLSTDGPKHETKRVSNQYYPVFVQIQVGEGNRFCDEIDIFHIPYMDGIGILNVQGSHRTCLNVIRTANNVSFDEHKSILMVTMKNRSLSIIKRSGTMYFQSPIGLRPLDEVINGYLFKSDIKLNLHKYFSNPMILSSLTNREFQQEWKIKDDANKHAFYEIYNSSSYEIGSLREALNEKLSFSGCTGMQLSREVNLPRYNKVLESGTIIDEGVLRAMKANLVNEIYVRCVPKADALYTAESIRLNRISKGTKLLSIIKDNVPEYVKYRYAPYSKELDNPITIQSGTIIDSELIDLLISSNITEIKCSPSRTSNNIFLLRFEQEYIGNNFHKIGDFMDASSIEATDFSHDDYVYIDDIVNYVPVRHTEYKHLTTYDILAITSLAARCLTDPSEGDCYNRDTEFLKRIDMVNELFEDALKKSITTTIMTQNKRKVSNDVSKTVMSRESFYKLTDNFVSELWKNKVLIKVEDTNPMTILTQVRRLTQVFGSQKEFDPRQAEIVYGHMGKVCPYETPEGKKVGLVNSMAEGCRVIDGIPRAPYYRVFPILKHGKGEVRYKLSTEVEYLSAIQEMNETITDAISLGIEEDRTFSNKRVIARTPDKGSGGSNTKLVDIWSKNITYVMADPEQHLSPAAQLVPFAAHDDAVRVSFALSRIRQALNLQYSQAPYVVTSMYKKMFRGTNDFVIYAEKAGVVLEVMAGKLFILYDGEEKEREIVVPEIKVSDSSIVTLNYKKLPNERFFAGEVLVDSSLAKDGYMSPGINVLVAFMPWFGYNYEDSVLVTKACASRLTSVYSDKIERKINNKNEYSSDTDYRMKYKYVTQGQAVAKINYSNYKDKRHIRCDEVKAEKTSGIVYDIMTIQKGSEKKLVVKLMCYKKLIPGDKMSGLHANKGVSSKIINTSEMVRLMNGEPIEMCVNIAGVNSRMNIGQILEAWSGLVCHLLGIKLESNSFNGLSLKELKDLLRFVWLIANESAEAACYEYSHFPEALKERAKEREEFCKQFEGCFYPDGTADLYLPSIKGIMHFRIAIGYMYMMKLIQEVDDKMHARSFAIEENYSSMSKQPPKGSSKGGGQRIGEMEDAALKAHGAVHILDEMLNVKSDNTIQRTALAIESMNLNGNDRISKYINKILSQGEAVNNPHSVDMLRYYLEVVGIQLTGEELASLDIEDVRRRPDLDISKVLAEINLESELSSNPEDEYDDIMGVMD